MENKTLDLGEKIAIRDYANLSFGKTYNFLQVKDPRTYFKLETLGRDLTVADEKKAWQDIIKNQQNILSKKRIKHRNFGDYSKHNCGYNDCPLNGLMVRQGSSFSEFEMHFKSDKKRNSAKEKSANIKKQRKNISAIIKKGAGRGITPRHL